MSDFGVGTSRCGRCGAMVFRKCMRYNPETRAWEHGFTCQPRSESPVYRAKERPEKGSSDYRGD